MRSTPAQGKRKVRRPRPAITRDNEFFWRGVERGELLIQRCACGRLRHPPGPMCPKCRSLEWDTIEAAGRGTVYSFVVARHPPIPPFEYPNVIVLVELEEGPRIVSNLIDVRPDEVSVGMPVRLEFVRVDEAQVLPQFRPVRGRRDGERTAASLRASAGLAARSAMQARASRLDNQTAIVGIGATEFSKNSGRSELRLAVEAALAALDDAGLTPDAVDGMCTFSMDNNPEIELNRCLGGGDLSFFSRIHYGGGAACATVMQAAMAVATGVCEVAICYRAMNERSQQRFGTGVQDRPPLPTTESAHFGWYSPYGLLTPASWVAMSARRYMAEYGATSEDFGRVSVADRRHAASNPAAWFYGEPITLEDHQNSRFIVEPLRLLDCCQESDGAVAVVVTSLARARDLRRDPVVIRAAAQGASNEQQMMTGYYADDITGLPEMALVARQLYATARIGPDDIQAAIIYDHFTPFVLTQLEEFGFCGRGEAKDFVRDGNIELGGRLPINTHGGQIGEAYIHGMNGVAEAVRLIRGTSVNQVEGAEHVVVTAGTGVPTSGLILGVDR